MRGGETGVSKAKIHLQHIGRKKSPSGKGLRINHIQTYPLKTEHWVRTDLTDQIPVRTLGYPRLVSVSTLKTTLKTLFLKGKVDSNYSTLRFSDLEGPRQCHSLRHVSA